MKYIVVRKTDLYVVSDPQFPDFSANNVTIKCHFKLNNPQVLAVFVSKLHDELQPTITFCVTEKKMAEYSKKAAVKPKPLSVLRSLEEKYVAVMKKLQFGRLRSVNICVLEGRYLRNMRSVALNP